MRATQSAKSRGSSNDTGLLTKSSAIGRRSNSGSSSRNDERRNGVLSPPAGLHRHAIVERRQIVRAKHDRGAGGESLADRAPAIVIGASAHVVIEEHGDGLARWQLRQQRLDDAGIERGCRVILGSHATKEPADIPMFQPPPGGRCDPFQLVPLARALGEPLERAAYVDFVAPAVRVQDLEHGPLDRESLRVARHDEARMLRIPEAGKCALDVVAGSARARLQGPVAVATRYAQRDCGDFACGMSEPAPPEEAPAANFEAVDAIANLGCGGGRHGGTQELTRGWPASSLALPERGLRIGHPIGDTTDTDAFCLAAAKALAPSDQIFLFRTVLRKT